MAEHRINHLEIELHSASVPIARAVSERLGQIHGHRVSPVLDRVCSELAAGDELVRLDRLEVDLGTLPADGFEDAFVDRLEQALRAALIQAVRRRGDGDRRAAAALEVVETFALTGGLPWWAPTDAGVVARHFAHAAVAAQGELLAVLRRIAGDPGAIDRLARLCDPDALVALVGRLQGGDPRQVRASDATERGALLRSLAVPPGPQREAGAARASPAAGPAHEPAAPTDAAHTRRPGTATVHQPGPPTARGDRGADAVDRSAPTSVAPLHRSAGAAAADAGSRSLHGTPVESDAPGPGDAEGEAWRGDGVPRDAVPGDAGPRDAAPGAPAARDTTRHASPIDRETAAHREPAQPAAPAARAPGDGRTAIAAEPDAPVAPRAAPLERPPAAPPALAAPGPAIAHAARRRALAQLDELYVDDAGLVILWPFLERLFRRAGLLGVDPRGEIAAGGAPRATDRRFVDEAAQVQAVALVELLATGDPEPLEFRLPLAKLLCGRPLESDLVLDRPLDPEQIAETDHLLAAVIDHAPVGELSIPGFRAAFLQRRAALTTRDGAWLLQVERQPHDAVLDRFPWSWSWIKLPWMPDPLRVEW